MFCALAHVLKQIPQEELQHMYRVKRLVAIIVHSLRLCEAHCARLKTEWQHYATAALFHDIGKAWIPNEILMKPDRLTAKEKEELFKHPLFAEQFLSNTPQGLCDQGEMTKLVFDAAVYHHERWDGKGYPYGLAGEAIPLIARIISVCDAYDAITQQRPYSRKRTHAQACLEIKKNAGLQFDPVISEHFLKNTTAFKIDETKCTDECFFL